VHCPWAVSGEMWQNIRAAVAVWAGYTAIWEDAVTSVYGIFYTCLCWRLQNGNNYAFQKRISPNGLNNFLSLRM